MSENNYNNITTEISNARGLRRYELLQHFANNIVYVPIIKFENVGDVEGTKKVKIAQTEENGKRVIHIYTTEEAFFNDDENSKYQCLNLPAGDLALTLPKNTLLFIDRSSNDTAVIQGEDISVLSGLNTTPSWLTESEQLDSPINKTLKNQIQYKQDTINTEKVLIEEKTFIASNSDTYFIPKSIEALNSVTEDHISNEEIIDFKDSLKVDSLEVKTELEKIFIQFPEIEEAYMIDHKNDTMALGILSEEMSLESRFNLIEEIANISREFYGEAGSIEVYDDLSASTSTSWELFRSYTPFYEKKFEEKFNVPLSTRIEWSKFQNSQDNQILSNDEELELDDNTFSWKTLRKRGLKLFSKTKQ